MGDAEIIPLGTRGRPGRGTGTSTPSSSSRNLATGPGSRSAAREQHPSVRVPAQKKAQKAAQKAAQDAAVQQAEQRAENEIARTTAEVETLTESEEVAEPTTRPLPSRAPVTTEHRHPVRGIPPLEWLAAFTSAAKEIFGESWEARLAEFLGF